MRVGIVRINSLTQKSYKTKENLCSSTNTARNDICHVDHDVTFSFKVMHEGHANGDSWNEFSDLKSLRNNTKIIAVGQIQAEITKVT